MRLTDNIIIFIVLGQNGALGTEKGEIRISAEPFRGVSHNSMVFDHKKNNRNNQPYPSR